MYFNNHENPAHFQFKKECEHDASFNFGILLKESPSSMLEVQDHKEYQILMLHPTVVGQIFKGMLVGIENASLCVFKAQSQYVFLQKRNVISI